MLAGGGPPDVVELTLALAREMLAGAGRDDVDPADALADGSAMDSWRAMIAAQGGDPDAPLPTARESHVVPAPTSGTLTRLDAMAVGLAAWRLGAGRARKEDAVQAGAGVVWHARPGDAGRARVSPLFTLLTDEPARFDRALEALEGGYDVADGVVHARSRWSSTGSAEVSTARRRGLARTRSASTEPTRSGQRQLGRTATRRFRCLHVTSEGSGQRCRRWSSWERSWSRLRPPGPRHRPTTTGPMPPVVDPPQSLTGTLVDATLEATDDASSCGATDGSVWYHFTAPPRGSVSSSSTRRARWTRRSTSTSRCGRS